MKMMKIAFIFKDINVTFFIDLNETYMKMKNTLI